MGGGKVWNTPEADDGKQTYSKEGMQDPHETVTSAERQFKCSRFAVACVPLV